MHSYYKAIATAIGHIHATLNPKDGIAAKGLRPARRSKGTPYLDERDPAKPGMYPVARTFGVRSSIERCSSPQAKVGG